MFTHGNIPGTGDAEPSWPANPVASELAHRRNARKGVGSIRCLRYVLIPWETGLSH
jgi:hypothetical protein